MVYYSTLTGLEGTSVSWITTTEGLRGVVGLEMGFAGKHRPTTWRKSCLRMEGILSQDDRIDEVEARLAYGKVGGECEIGGGSEVGGDGRRGGTGECGDYYE